MTTRSFLISLIALVGACQGCATSFTGDAHYPGGAARCWTRCSAENLRMSAFVYMGEYSSACVCAPVSSPAGPVADEGGASGPAVVGVVMQMRQAEAQARR